MKAHRFYIDTILTDEVVVSDRALLHQWSSVLRFDLGREIELFNGKSAFMYRLSSLSKNEARLEKLHDVNVLKPSRELYLCFSLLKKDKNEWILQKGTELGVSHFVPVISARTEKTGWNEERAEKIVIEAAEQCGRTDVPSIISPTKLKMVQESLPKDVKLYVAEQSNLKPQTSKIQNPVGILIGPEGGWTDGEKNYFSENDIETVSLSEFTLRAETAAITAVSKLL